MLTDHCTRRPPKQPLAFAPLPHALRKDPRLTPRAVPSRRRSSSTPAPTPLRPHQPPARRGRPLLARGRSSTPWPSSRPPAGSRIEQGPDGRVIHLVWREAPRATASGPHATAASTSCNGRPDPRNGLHPPHATGCGKKKRGEGEERNVTNAPPPGGRARTARGAPGATPGHPRRPPGRPHRPAAQGRAEGPPRGRGAAGPVARLAAAHHLGDLASVGFFVMCPDAGRCRGGAGRAGPRGVRRRRPIAGQGPETRGDLRLDLDRLAAAALAQRDQPARLLPGATPGRAIAARAGPDGTERTAGGGGAEDRAAAVRGGNPAGPDPDVAGLGVDPRHPLAGIARRNLAACRPEELAGEGP